MEDKVLYFNDVEFRKECRTMNEFVLYRKITRIIMQLSDELQISPKRAMLLFYSTRVGAQMHDAKYGYQVMSDTYIVNDIKSELRG